MSRRAFLAGTAATVGTAAMAKFAAAQNVATPVKTNYFPANAAWAPYPSPEGSIITVYNGVAGLLDSSTGKPVDLPVPYIRDRTGNIYSFGDKPVPGRTPNNFVIYKNGAPMQVGNKPSATALTICQGLMYFQEMGYWNTITASGGGAATIDLPPFQPAKGQQYVAATSSSPGTTPNMPTAPAAVSPAPGSSGNIVKAGPSQTIKSLGHAVLVAKNGDTIQLDPGTYSESVAITKAVKIIGGGVTANPGTAGASWSGGAKINATGVALAQGKGALLAMTDVILEGLEITGAGLSESVGGGTAGIRNGAPGNFVVRNCYIHDNQDGVFSGGYAATWVLENNLITDNGIGDGQTHNIYLGREVAKADFANNTSIIGPAAPSKLRKTGKGGGGHAYKCRANISTFNGGYGRAAETVVDLPDGSTQTVNIKGMTMVKNAGDAAHRFLDYAVESGAQGVVGVIVSGCNFILNCVAPFVQVGNSGVIVFDSTNKWQGNKPTANGVGTITGLPT